MNPSQERFTVLFNRYYEGTATPKETDELMGLIQASKDDDQLSQLLKEKWESLPPDDAVFSARESDRILNSILKPEPEEEIVMKEGTWGKVWTINWLPYAAAAIVLLIGFIVFRSWQPDSANDSKLAARPKTAAPVSVGSNRATLTLGDGSKIVLDGLPDGLVTRQSGSAIHKTTANWLVYRPDAQAKTTGNPPINALTTPTGGQFQVELPDGSKVWLNACSSIRFPAVFAENERWVEVKGEAFFEVKKDPSRPFTARFGNTAVEVLGTSFNIMAYDNETTTRTTLVEGSVRLRHAENRAQLRPQQQATVRRDGRVKVEAVDLEEALAWKSGLFYFKEASIESVMRQIARWYDIKVKYEGKIPVRQLTGKVSRNVPIQELLSMLHYAGLNYRLEGHSLTIRP